jgi:hypothetical protein
MMRFWKPLNEINHIDRLVCVDEYGNFTSITSVNNKLTCYVQYANGELLTVYGASSSFVSAQYFDYLLPLDTLDLGFLDFDLVHGPIGEFIRNIDRTYTDINEEIVDLKISI